MLTKSITTKLAALCGAALITAAMSAPASAMVIFEDDFNRATSTTVGMGWTEIEQGPHDVKIVSNSRLRIRDDNPFGSATQAGLSTAGLQNITLSFDVRGIDTEFSDFLVVEYDTGSGFTNLMDIPLVNTVTFDSITNFPIVGADDSATFALRFSIDCFGCGSTEGALIDNVKLEGDLIPVPEPGSLALFGLGLAGLGYARRRKVA